MYDMSCTDARIIMVDKSWCAGGSRSTFLARFLNPKEEPTQIQASALPSALSIIITLMQQQSTTNLCCVT